MKTKVVKILVTIAALALMTGCSEDSSPSAVSPTNIGDGANLQAFAKQGPADALRGPDGMTIVEIALAVNDDSGEFSTLIAALSEAGLVDALNGKKQFTVFAPTDAAFAAANLNADNIGDVPVADLTNILLYHVAHGRRYAEDVVEADRIRMLNKGFTFVDVNADGAFINDAPIVDTDIEASNGIIHVIGGVLLPE